MTTILIISNLDQCDLVHELANRSYIASMSGSVDQVPEFVKPHLVVLEDFNGYWIPIERIIDAKYPGVKIILISRFTEHEEHATNLHIMFHNLHDGIQELITKIMTVIDTN